jgi:hypothetical protein
MSDRQPSPDLQALERTYEIVGELRGASDTHRFVARRRDDGVDVMITVVRAPQDDGNNALAHLASDTQLLGNAGHPGVLRVHTGQWLGADAYAVISDPIHATPLAELVSRGERIANARVAVVLQDVDGVLDWARNQGIVHRKVTPETLWFEPGTDRVMISFAASRIPISGVPDARGDAKTIGVLAWSMLAGRRYDELDDKANPPLAELCPELAARVVGATEAMIRSESVDEAPDVPAFLALIASGDVLRRAEVEMAALQTDFAERHRIAEENNEKQKAEVEAAAAEHASRLAGERDAFERLVHERQEQLGAIRAELDKQRVAITRRLAELDKRRVALDQMRSELDLREANMHAKRPAAPEEFPNDLHWTIPVGLTAIVMLLLAGLVASMAHPRRASSSSGDVVAPRSAPFGKRPAPTRGRAAGPAPVIRDTTTLRIDTTTPRVDTATSRVNTTARDTKNLQPDLR